MKNYPFCDPPSTSILCFDFAFCPFRSLSFTDCSLGGIKPFSSPNLKDVIFTEMPSSNWSELVQHCQPVSNVSLVCRDGVVYTHKIVLASVSGFVETLLSDIPV